jgi:hypothetical protein
MFQLQGLSAYNFIDTCNHHIYTVLEPLSKNYELTHTSKSYNEIYWRHHVINIYLCKTKQPSVDIWRRSYM